MSLAGARSRREKKRNSMRSMREGIVDEKPYTINDPKINVPKEMLEAACKAALQNAILLMSNQVRLLLETALRWQRNNAPVPTEKQVESLAKEHVYPNLKWMMAEWVRRMYDDPEPDEIQQVADAIKGAHTEYHPTNNDYRAMATAAIEAYRRGKKAGA